METYDTILDRARALKDELEAFALSRSHGLPSRSYVQVGDIQRDCASVVVSAGGLTPDPLYDPVTCVSPRTATFIIEIIRDCAIVFDAQGLTVPTQLEAISETSAEDGSLLYDFAEGVYGWSSKSPWTVVWGVVDGALFVASLQLTIGVP